MKRRAVILVVLSAVIPAVAAPPQLRFVDCASAGFDPSLARAVFESEAKAPGAPIEVRCQGTGVAHLRRGASSRDVRLDGLSPTVRATTLGMVLIEMAREAPSSAVRPAPAPLAAESAEPVARPKSPPGASGGTLASPGPSVAARGVAARDSAPGAAAPASLAGRTTDSARDPGSNAVGTASLAGRTMDSAQDSGPNAGGSASLAARGTESARDSGPNADGSALATRGTASARNSGPNAGGSASLAARTTDSARDSEPNAGRPASLAARTTDAAQGSGSSEDRSTSLAARTTEYARDSGPTAPGSASLAAGGTASAPGAAVSTPLTAKDPAPAPGAPSSETAPVASDSSPESAPAAARTAATPPPPGDRSFAASARATLADLTASIDGPHGGGATLVPFDAALLPSVSINASVGGRTRNFLSLGLLGSRTTHLDGVSATAGASLIDESLHGLQLAGAFASAGSLTGAQAAGAVSWNGGATQGLQLGGALAWAGGDTLGVQGAGGVAITRGSVLGAQLAPLSIAGPVLGAQLGVVNVGGDVDGAQVGVVNIARRVRGLQLGVVNVSDSTTVPLGLVSVIADGAFHVSAWSSETTLANVALKLGGRHVYTHVDLGWNPRGSGRANETGPGLPWGYGFGWTLGPERGLFGEVELTFLHLWEFPRAWTKDFSAGLRTQWGWRFKEQLALFAGAQLQVFGQMNPTAEAPTPFGWTVHDASDVRITLAPGVLAGVEL